MPVPNLYGAGMGANPGDSPQIALVKIVAQLAELTTGMSVPNLYGAGMGANPGDSLQISLVKIVAHLRELATALGGGGGGGAVGGITVQAGDPALDGSIATLFYHNTTAHVTYVNTGTIAVPAWEPV